MGMIEKVEIWSDVVPNHIRQMEFNLSRLKMVDDPQAKLIAGWIEDDLNRLKRNTGIIPKNSPELENIINGGFKHAS